MRKKIWIRSLLLFVLVVIAASVGFSRFLYTTSARAYLIAKLQASFGRPVEVRQFGFSLLDGARLEARSLTVSEDPRFGNEYFLRADSLTAGLNWLALLSGRFEFGTLSLSQPSLNLVRDRQGRWNIEDWLPAASPQIYQPGFVGPRSQTASSIVRLISIVFDAGRINFKQGDEKTPFALLNVSGRVDQNGPTQWRLDLEAVPMRAGVTLQDSGTLRLRGTIGSTTARLQPADLNLTWRQVSVADVLRLTRLSDFGVRGELDVDLNARVRPLADSPSGVENTVGGRWAISGVARVTGMHRWDLPERPMDPSGNLSVDASWHLGDRHAQVEKILVEMPQSHLQGAGELDWARGFRPEFHIESSSLGLSDVLNAYRAFRPGVPENINLTGVIGLDATLAGWPLQLQQGALASAGAQLSGPSLPSELRVGEINASAARGGLDFAPTEISFLEPAGQSAAGTQGAATRDTFLVHGAIIPGNLGPKPWPPSWTFSIVGETARIQDWQALAQALAQFQGNRWAAAGGVAINLAGTHRAGAPETIWLGTLDTHNLIVSPVFLNQPLRFPKARIEFAQTQRTITLAATEAFGATWRGTVTRKVPAGPWTFDLSADRLDAADLDRWLGPRARPGLFERITSLGGTDTSSADTLVRDTTVSAISARGRLRVAQIALAPLTIAQLDTTLSVDGRNITAEKAKAAFSGGNVAATFRAELAPDPVYHFDGAFDRVNLSLLAHALPTLRDRLSGTASGALTLTTHGVGHAALMLAIQGNGTIDAKDAQVAGLNLAPVLAAPASDPIPAHFAAARGRFRFSSDGIEISNLALDRPPAHFVADGHVDLSTALAIHFHRVLPTGKPSSDSTQDSTYSLGGTLEAPKWISSEAPTQPATKVSEFRK